MTMHVPVRLKRLDTPAAADAVLVAGADVRALAAVARVVDPAGVYRVRDGYVIVLKAPATAALPGIRLRRAGGDFYLPADAAVLPALLPDEIAGLTRNHGIVALPGGPFLAFDPHAPLPPHAWLATKVRRDEWHPFPARPVRPERLTTIERPSPPAAAEDILIDGQPENARPLPGAGSGNGAGTVPEDARPAAGSGIGKVTAKAAFGMGRFLNWLGRMLKSPRLAQMGGGLVRKAVERVPRLTEKIFGDQEAALREVLRQLQSGDVEAGLRRAPIAVPDPEVPARVDHGDRLADRDPRFSLRDLLGGGTTTIWLRGGDVWAALADEYRRLAAEAVRRGDYRRAAYLHGFLLRDFRTAANVLMSGGHFHEAALLYRDKLKDHAAAAAAFEKAGDIDEAVRLLDGLGMFEPAGDLLLRAGDGERAHDRFHRAADRLARDGRWLAAGDLVRRKAGDRIRAVHFYQSGWDGPGAESVTCAERLVDEYFLAEDWAAADALFDRAEDYLAPPFTAEAGRLFNYALTVGQDFLPPDRREALADRTRLAFARHLKTAALRGRAGPVAADLFGRDAPWPGPVVRDAAYAARQGERRRPATSLPLDAPPVKLADGTTVGVVAAHESRDLIVATTRAVVCWRAADGRVVPLYQGAGREVLGLSADPAGRMVFVLFGEGPRVYLTSYVAHGANSFSSVAQHEVTAQWDLRELYHLHPAAHPRDGDVRVTLYAGDKRMMFAGPLLRPRATGEGRDVYLRVVGEPDVWGWDVGSLRWFGDAGTVTKWRADWEPAIPEGSPLTVRAVDWMTPSPRVLQIVGVDRPGVVHWSKFDAHRTDGPTDSKQTASLAHPAGFLAACLERPDHVVAATATNELHWLRAGGKGLEPRTAPRTLPVPARIVALAARRPGEGVAAVLEDGSAVVVHRPAG
jgi:hypothetical protein